MKLSFAAIITIHALIHIAGFAKGLQLAAIPQITQPIGLAEGIVWLLAALLLLVSVTALFLDGRLFRTTGAVAILVSQLLIIIHWRDAAWGTPANALLLVPVIVSFARYRPGSAYDQYRKYLAAGLARNIQAPLLTETDIARLPQPVQRYIRYTGSIGKPLIRNFCAEFDGWLRQKPGAAFMKMEVQQCNFYDQPSRFFYIRSWLYGIPFDGLHRYADGKASMLVKVASLFPVVNGSGKQMTRSETVTMFNDICCWAPAELASAAIRWAPVDDTSAKAWFTNAGITISATLYFNSTGELIDFSSDDRLMSVDGKTFTSCRWTTPVSDYKDFGGRRIASYGEAIWHTPDGELCYGKFRLRTISYNSNARH